MTANPQGPVRVVPESDLIEVRDMLLERIHGNPARSAAHNARLAVEAILAAPPPAAPEGVEPSVDVIAAMIVRDARLDVTAGFPGSARIDNPRTIAANILAALSPVPLADGGR